MLSDPERRQWDALEAQLMAESHRLMTVAGRAARGAAGRARRAAVLVAAAAMITLAAAHVLVIVPLRLLGGLALYLVVPCWFYATLRRNCSRGRGRSSGRG